MEVGEGEGTALQCEQEDGTEIDLENEGGCVAFDGGGEGPGLRRSLISSLATGSTRDAWSIYAIASYNLVFA